MNEQKCINIRKISLRVIEERKGRIMSVSPVPHMAHKKGRAVSFCHVKSYATGLPRGKVIAAERSWREDAKCLGTVGVIHTQHCVQYLSEG